MPNESDQSSDATAEEAPADRAAAQETSDTAAPESAHIGSVGLWWAGLTVVAVVATYFVQDWLNSGKPFVAGIWATHSLIGWSVTLRAIRHSVSRTAIRRQTLEIWCVAAAATWAIIATSQVGGIGVMHFEDVRQLRGVELEGNEVALLALPEWAAVTMIQIIAGLALVSTGASVRDGLTTVCGLICIVSVPVLLSFGETINPGLWSLVMMIAAIMVSVLSISFGWRKMRMAAQRRADNE